MTTGPETPDPTQPYGAQDPSAVPPPPPPPPAAAPTPGYAGYQQPGLPAGAYGVSSQAPYGLHPATGIPFSDKSKIVAGLLQIFLPFGIGRFYIGDNKIGVIQLVVTVLTCGIGGIWGIIDGIIMLATDSKDANGYMLRS
jgi:TM2 domain-containing membrane protein YozV